MSISSLYQNIANKNITINSVDEPPPIIKSDVNQYANILAKKSHLNTKALIQEAAPQPQPAAQNSAQAPTGTPAQAMVPQKANILQLSQQVGQKFANAVEPARTLVANILSSLLK